MQNTKIVIMGNGKIGEAILHLLNQASATKHDKCLIDIYDNDPLKNKSGKTLKDCTTNANFVFLCLPSWHTGQALLEIKPFLKKNTIIISVAKGLEAISKNSIDELIEKNLKKQKYALLSGPMFAEEIINNEKSFAVLASTDKNVFAEISKLFVSSNLKLEYSKKVHSVAMAGVLKNVYTLIVSIIETIEKSKNVKGYISAEAINEMLQISKILKLDKKIILGVSGLADFVATSSCEYSQNKKTGVEICTAGVASTKSEGLISLPSLLLLLGKKSKKLPLLSLAENILIKKEDAKKETEKFFE